MIKIILPGKPLIRKIKKGRYGQVYNATEKEEFAIQLIIKNEARKVGFKRNDKFQLPVRLSFFIDKASPGRPPDPYNLEKVYRDCIKRAGLVKDDSDQYLDIYREYTRGAGVESRVEITVYD